MASRQRQSAAIIRPSNAIHAPVAGLPPYEVPTYPLNPKAQRALAALKTQHPSKRIDDRVTDTIEKITNCAGDINDRLTQKSESAQKRKARRERDGVEDDDLTEQERANLEQMSNRVQQLTERMDLELRKMIDDRATIKHINEALQALQYTVDVHASQLSNVQMASTAREDEEMIDNLISPTTGTIPNSTQTARPPALVDMFKLSIQNNKDYYQSNSLYHRYAENSTYSDFKRIVHDAQYPGDEIPPLPASTSWFPNTDGDGPAPGVTSAGLNKSNHTVQDSTAFLIDEDEDDIAIARERTSTKCPITLLEFVEPVTSLKCPHSFERSVIESLIRTSRPPTRMRHAATQWVPNIQCPVPGCEEILGLADLKTDPVLVRRIKRIQAARERAANRVAAGASSDVEQAAESVASGSGTEDDGDDIDALHGRHRTPMVKLEMMRRSGRALDDDIEDD